MGTGYFPGLKRPGCGFHHPAAPSAEVKERVQLYHYSSSGPSWPVTVTFTFTSLKKTECLSYWLNAVCYKFKVASNMNLYFYKEVNYFHIRFMFSKWVIHRSTKFAALICGLSSLSTAYIFRFFVICQRLLQSAEVHLPTTITVSSGRSRSPVQWLTVGGQTHQN